MTLLIYITSISSHDYFYDVEKNTYVGFNKYDINPMLYDRKNAEWKNSNGYIKPIIKERTYVDLKNNWLDIFDNIILNKILDNI